MDKQEVYIAAHISNGVVQSVENSVITQPVVHFNSGEVKWYEDKARPSWKENIMSKFTRRN